MSNLAEDTRRLRSIKKKGFPWYVLESLLFEVTPNDPATLVAVAGGLVIVAGLAAALPARRATRVDAIVALQGE